MALVSQPPTATWPRWQQQASQDCSMMGTPGMVSYDSRTTTTAPLQRTLMAPQYVFTAYSSGPTSTIESPQYHPPSPYQYGPYYSPSVGQQSSPLRAPQPERQIMRHMDVQQSGMRTPEDDLPHSPLGRNEPTASMSPVLNPCATSKTISVNQTIDPTHQINFATNVDELMKTIQTKGAANEIDAGQNSLITPAASPRAEEDFKPQKRRKYICDGPNCNKTFVQKTHLDIHRRTHSGARPYVCEIANCGHTFSQRGNLKTHMRRHTGERPYRCGTCGKAFAQRGNVRSHEQTHSGLKKWSCKLDGCNKTFSQLGNMKTHQNNFHKETLTNLTMKFAKFAEIGQVPEQYQELFDYFKLHYKNSNKGIKGRGKDRKVAQIKAPSGRQTSVAGTSRVSLEAARLPERVLTCPSQSFPSPQHMAAYPVASSPQSIASSMSPVAANYGLYAGNPGHSGHSAIVYTHGQQRDIQFANRMY